MSRGNRSDATVVLAACVIGRSFFDPPCRRVLELWRDGAIRPVVTPALLKRYARVLNGLGLPYRLVRQWALWFTSPETSLYLDCEDGSIVAGGPEIYLNAARLGPANVIVAAAARPSREADEAHPFPPNVAWLSPADFLASRET